MKMCNLENFLDVCQVADLYNANRLKEFCSWYQRINPKVNDVLFLNGIGPKSLDQLADKEENGS
jgi:hypothetical protein